MKIGTRKFMILVLSLLFFLQTALIYLDGSGRQQQPLSSQAAAGRQLWHEYNCQSCHQIYGFGGFLGPDVTNAISYMTPARMQTILTEGSGQMPAFHFNEQDIAAMTAFFTELDRTGIGQAKVVEAVDVAQRLNDLILGFGIEDEKWSLQLEQGNELLRTSDCIGCHLPNSSASKQAPDITELYSRLGEQGIKAVLKVGRPERGMPNFHFTPTESDAVCAIILWMNAHKIEIQSAMNQEQAGAQSWLTRLPWFEYK